MANPGPRSSTDQQHPTAEPFTDPKADKGSHRQKAANAIALPLAAAGGVVAEVSRKVKELVTGHSTKIDTSHKDHNDHKDDSTSASN
ncbi:hypothetical protein BGX28_000376 [Mortierella sp. GBA30]|nr:hypothetical protein BGX28_000376 [Mortierella sp. GBA30]